MTDEAGGLVGAGNPFTLDNGLEQLKPFFSRVRMLRYDDDLHVTDVEPLMAFIQSTYKAKELSDSALTELRQELENLLKTQGEIFITKDSGLFMAVK